MANEFLATEFRCRCLNVVDGDTVDLCVDIGFHVNFTGRFRVLGIDTAELNSKEPTERYLAIQAKGKVAELLKPSLTTTGWPLVVRTKKDPDSFGRWLADISYFLADGTKMDLGPQLILEGLAKPYKG